ncbi:MAG: caspase family protein [Planctomycetales bacterium]|nr:caspase family protein [Planctomycetales bacterium]
MDMRCLIAIVLLLLSTSSTYAKYPLLVGVSTYEHVRLNETQLKFPEEDAKAIATLLEDSGYEVKLLIGKQATRHAIRDALVEIAKTGGADDVLALGFFGHGVQYGESFVVDRSVDQTSLW